MIDVAIIGAGPAGLFAAHELATKSKLSVTIFDMGFEMEKRYCPAVERGECIVNCKPCHIMCGLGGAGGMSSGILNLRHDIGGDLSKLTGSVEKAKKLVEEVDSTFLEHGAPAEIYGAENGEAEALARKAAAVGVKFIPIPQRHIGSEYLPGVINSLRRELEGRGVRFSLNSRVEQLRKGELLVNGRWIRARYIIAAPGRIGASWFAEQAKALGVELTHSPIDVGVRVEVPAVVYEPVVRVNRDPKFHIRTKTFDDFVRTFCIHPDEPIIYEKDGILHVTPIKYAPEDARIVSVNLQGGTICLARPQKKTVRRYKGKMVRIKLARGGELCVTADHPLFVKDDIDADEGKILEYLPKRAEEVEVGQVLPSIRRMLIPKFKITELNLIEEFEKSVPEEFLKKIFVRGVEHPITGIKIKGIETFDYDGEVFDFSVPPYRTFTVGRLPIIVHNCTNHQGFVMEESYGGHVNVNGQSLRKEKSQNTNFALLVRVELTKPVTDTTAYGRSIAQLATTIGGGKPLLQRLGDLRAGRRSSWERIERGHVEPTLRSVTPGDISMTLPGRIVTDILEGLEVLDRVVPGVASDSTLLYAPEVKFYSMRASIDKNMETNVPGIFVAGDGTGQSRGIVAAAATGLLAARGILEKEGVGA